LVSVRFHETQPEPIDLFPGQLLNDSDSAEARLQARFTG
jgi:hypothetical protein